MITHTCTDWYTYTQACTQLYIVANMHTLTQMFSCTVSGFVFQFAFGVILGCWLAQLTYMVILLYFPFFGERTLKKKKKLYHAISIVVIITLSLISPVVTLAWFNYVIVRFPPLMCLPSNQDWIFYSMVLPGSIVMATGTIFCILLIRAIHKVSVLTAVSLCAQIDTE